MALFPDRLLQTLTVLAVLLVNCHCYAGNSEQKQAFIVILDGSINSTRSVHLGILKKVLKSGTPEDSLIYSYRTVIRGFSAKLSEKEACEMKRIPGVIGVWPSRRYHIETGSGDLAGNFSNLDCQSFKDEGI